jgi:hypothetical protein
MCNVSNAYQCHSDLRHLAIPTYISIQNGYAVDENVLTKCCGIWN